MPHPITADTRLVNTGNRLYARLFNPDDPHGWADYHSVTSDDGYLWIHTHGLARRGLPELEIVDVPAPLRGHAHQLMFGIVARLRELGREGIAEDIDGRFSTPSQNFRQPITLCPAFHDDAAHRNILRIVDRGMPVEAGFPRRLFAAHLTAWAELADDPARKEAMCRQALAIDPGCFLEMMAGAEIDPGNPDFTDLQQRASLAAYVTLAEALYEQGRTAEGERYYEEAAARCPGWAQVHRAWLVGKYRRKDAFMNFWRELDLTRICTLYRPANSTGPLPKLQPKRSGGTGRKKQSA